MTIKRIYTGKGQPKPARDLPSVNPEALRDPAGYRAPPDLAAAVDVALTLGMPLLITGEPGCGKSALADSIAYELGLGRGALRFIVKSDTEARDLFYRFDTVGRFHASQTRDSKIDAAEFISFAALGEAILRAKSREDLMEELKLPPELVKRLGKRTRSVVLIDEIDKAPRDVPNDILVEIENMEFSIPELSGSAKRGEVRVALKNKDGEYDNDYRPIVVFTSNQEKALPEPFLRRCVFFHLNFPPFEAPEGDEDTVTVSRIVMERLGGRYSRKQVQMNLAIDFFRFLRIEARHLERRPVLSELLDWLHYLAQSPLLEALRPGATPELQDGLLISIETLLLKRPGDQRREEDRRRALEWLEYWRKDRKLEASSA